MGFILSGIRILDRTGSRFSQLDPLCGPLIITRSSIPNSTGLFQARARARNCQREAPWRQRGVWNSSGLTARPSPYSSRVARNHGRFNANERCTPEISAGKGRSPRAARLSNAGRRLAEHSSAPHAHQMKMQYCTNRTGSREEEVFPPIGLKMVVPPGCISKQRRDKPEHGEEFKCHAFTYDYGVRKIPS